MKSCRPTGERPRRSRSGRPPPRRGPRPRRRPGQSDPIPVKAPNDAAFAATFLEPADFKEKPIILPEPYDEWDFRVSIPLESTCPYSWPEIDRTFAEHGEGAGLYVHDSRTFGPDCLIVHVAQFRWWLRSVEEAEFYWDDTLRCRSRRRTTTPSCTCAVGAVMRGRGSPLKLDGADDRWCCAPRNITDASRSICCSRRLPLREGLFGGATPGTLAEDFRGPRARGRAGRMRRSGVGVSPNVCLYEITIVNPSVCLNASVINNFIEKVLTLSKNDSVELRRSHGTSASLQRDAWSAPLHASAPAQYRNRSGPTSCSGGAARATAHHQQRNAKRTTTAAAPTPRTTQEQSKTNETHGGDEQNILARRQARLGPRRRPQQ